MNLSPNTAPASMSLRPPALRAALALACGLAAWLALAASPAAATVIHNQEGSFNGADRPTLGSFQGVLDSAAADQSSGDVWVTEAKYGGFFGKADAVDRFNEKGEYAGIQITGEGTPQGGFNFGGGLFAGLAVDNTASGPNKGDLYLSDIGNGVVDRFSSSGSFECQITGKEPAARTPAEAAAECNGLLGSEPPDHSIEPAGLAVDSAGDLYVADRAHNVIDVFGPSGAYKEQITDSHLESPASIALDSAGNLYVTNFQENVVKFDSSGHFVKVVIAREDQPAGVAVDPATNHLYVGILQTNPTTHESESAIAEYEPSSSSPTPLDVFASSNRPGYVQAFAGLAVGPTGKLYAAEFFVYPNPDKVLIFSPDVAIPTVTTNPATGVEEATATLNGHLDPDAAYGGGEITSCQFEYGPTKAYGETAPCSSGPSYSGPEDVSAAITGLRPSTTYHFRLKAANANGIQSTGEDETLTTPGPPSIDYSSAEAWQTAAIFRARITPWGYDADCHVQYVADATFQQSGWADARTVPCSPEDLGSGFGTVRAKVKVTGLTQATVYHYRFLAANRSGVTGTPDRTFETYNIEEFSVEEYNSSHADPNVIWLPGERNDAPLAGAHPYEIVTNVALNKTTIASSTALFSQEEAETHGTIVDAKDIRVGLPPGLIGNPTASPKCSHQGVFEETCPGASQIGRFEVFGSAGWSWTEPLYNLVPAHHAPAEFGAFIEGQAGAWIPFGIRTGSDYGVTANSINLIAGVSIERVRVIVWGVPADPGHDEFRACLRPDGHRHTPCADPEPLEKPLLTNPTSCTGPQAATLALDSWQEPGHWLETSSEMPAFTGCNALQFAPTLEALPTTSVADSPSGLHVDLHVPQNLTNQGFEDPHGLATADLKDAKVTLPPGMVVNPASASGLAACSPAQIELHGPEPAQCPDAAKIGRVEVDTPLVDHPLPGAVYVATPYNNPFNSLLAIYVVVNDPETGVIIKLAGHIEADPETGQLTTTFDENPQLPFEDFKLDFFGGPRAALRTAPTCGTYESQSVLKPWSWPESGEPVKGTSPFKIVSAPGGAPCPAKAAEEPNSPAFSAGTETPTAGSYSPFVLHLRREDDSQELKGINTVLPPGLSAKLAGVAECPNAALEAAEHKTGTQERESPSCPSGSEIGTVNVGSGAGPAPYYVQGHAYLSGPYKGAPLSLAIVTPAVAGPYDLGDVVVKAGLYVNPETAQVTVKSDPIPTILHGVPLDVRTIAVKMGRPDFTLNPTNCEKMAVGGEALSVLGQSAALSDPFQVGSCEALGFAPKLALSLKGGTKRGQNPALKAVLTAKPGEANIAKAQVTLPHSEFLDNAHIQTVCTRVQFAANQCPAASVYGFAKAVTPLLDNPLEGPVYLRSSSHKLPDLVAALNGQINVDLAGKVDTGKGGGIRNTFEVVPDAPVTKFTLSMQGGKKGLLVNSENICAKPQHAIAGFTAQSGKVSDTEPLIANSCKGKKHGKHHKRAHRRAG